MRSDHHGRHMKVHLKIQPEVQTLEKSTQTDSKPESVHNNVAFKCPHCDFETARKDKLKRHIESVHNNVAFKCPHCDFETARKDKLKRHIESVHNNVAFNCNQCEFVANRKDNLKRHQKIKHGGPRPVYGGSEPEKKKRRIDQDESTSVIDGRNKQPAEDESKNPNKNDAKSNNMDELMEESMEVWKIHKLLQRMKKKE